jgi:hypothetical protein
MPQIHVDTEAKATAQLKQIQKSVSALMAIGNELRTKYGQVAREATNDPAVAAKLTALMNQDSTNKVDPNRPD